MAAMAKEKLEYPKIVDPTRATNKWWTGQYDRQEVYGPLWFWRHEPTIKELFDPLAIALSQR
jgi:hypothetical protein